MWSFRFINVKEYFVNITMTCCRTLYSIYFTKHLNLTSEINYNSRVPGPGYRTFEKKSDPGSWMSDIWKKIRIPGPGYRVFENKNGSRIPGIGYLEKKSDPGSRISDIWKKIRIPDPGYRIFETQIRIPDPGYRMLLMTGSGSRFGSGYSKHFHTFGIRDGS